MFLASDDDGAAAEIGALAENPGFAPVKLGGFRKVDCLCTRGKSWGHLRQDAFLFPSRVHASPHLSALAVIPGDDQRDAKSNSERQDQHAVELVGSTEPLGNHVQHLDQRERERDVSQRPLDQLALLQAREESGRDFVHDDIPAPSATGRRASNRRVGRAFIGRRMPPHHWRTWACTDPASPGASSNPPFRCAARSPGMRAPGAPCATTAPAATAN